MDIFQFHDYRTYISIRLDNDPSAKISRSNMAHKLKVNPSFVSQVLSGKVDFSLEHTVQLNEYFEHTAQEADFFILLVQKSRAGSTTLKRYFNEKIDQILKARTQISSRVESQALLEDAELAKYFESWIPMAIHIALSISELRSPSALAESLGISEKKVREIIEFLISRGLCDKKSYEIDIQGKQIHFGVTSDFLKIHHKNWRAKAIQNIDSCHPENAIHYSSTLAISAEDAKKVWELHLDFIQKIKKIVKHSKEEKIFQMNLDFFSLQNN